MPKAAKTAQQPFITLEPETSVFRVLFVNGGITPVLSKLPYKKGNLQQFLDKVWEKLRRVQPKLNKKYLQIDRSGGGPKNVQITRHFNGVGSWAYAMACELDPYQREFRNVPINFLYRDHMYPLEEVYTKTFAMAHVFGGEDESAVGLRGLLTDFVSFGGVSPDGGPGPGLSLTIRAHVRAYFQTPHGREDVLYRSFGELNRTIFALVVDRYPRVARPLAGEWEFWRGHPFLHQGVPSSPVRDEMLNQWDAMISELRRK